MPDPRFLNVTADVKAVRRTSGFVLEEIESIAGGTSTSDYMTTAQPDVKFLKFYCQSTAATGDARIAYMRLNLNGDGTGGGEAGRFYTTISAALTTSSVHGVHSSVQLDEGGSHTGQTAAGRFTWAAAADTKDITGTHYGLLVETDIATGNTLAGTHALLGFKDLGAVKSPLFADFSGLTAADAGSAIQADTGAVGTPSHYLVCKMPGGATGYIVVYSSHS